MKFGKILFNLFAFSLLTLSGLVAQDVSPYHWRPVPDEVMWIGDIHCVQKFNGAHYFGDDGGIIKWDATTATRVRGITGSVYAMTQFADTLYVGGKFPGTQFLGMSESQNANIRILKNNQWQSLPGSSLNNTVRALHHDGVYLHAGGDFINAGGDADADYIAFHNGNTWQSLGGSGTGLSNAVHTITSKAGAIYAGGEFLDAGGDINADRVAKYESGLWNSLGGASPGLNDTVSKILFRQNTLYASGDFSEASGLSEAVGFSFFGHGPQWWPATNDAIPGIKDFELVGNKIVIAGSFIDANNQAGADYLAQLDVSQYHLFSQVGNGFNVETNGIYHDGETLITFGSFRDANGNTAMDFVARLEGDDWVPMFHLNKGIYGEVKAIAQIGDTIFAAGDFQNAGGDPDADYIAKLENGVWQSLAGPGSGLNGVVVGLQAVGADLYIAGNFTDAGGDAAGDYVAKYVTGSLTSVGGVGSGLSDRVFRFYFLDSELYILGNFTNAGGDPNADFLAKLNGGNWTAVGGGFQGRPYDIFHDGQHLYVGGESGGEGLMAITHLNTGNLIHFDLETNLMWDDFHSVDVGPVKKIEVYDEKIYVEGEFTPDVEDEFYQAEFDLSFLARPEWDGIPGLGQSRTLPGGLVISESKRNFPVSDEDAKLYPYIREIFKIGDKAFAVGELASNAYGDPVVGMAQVLQNKPPTITTGIAPPNSYPAPPHHGARRVDVNISSDSRGDMLIIPLSALDGDEGDMIHWEIFPAPPNLPYPGYSPEVARHWINRYPRAYGRSGSASIVADGNNAVLYFTPNDDWLGSRDYLSVFAVDLQGAWDVIQIYFFVRELPDAPILTEGESITRTIVNDGTPLTFELKATDPDEEDLSFTWSLATPATNGTALVSGTGDKQTVAYTPDTDFVGNDSFMVKAADEGGLFDSITVNVVVKENPTPPTPANEAPVADIGVDQSVEEGATVTLDSSASSDDNGIASFKWSVVSGLPIFFSNDLAANPTFVAPPVTVDGGQTVIQLAINDEEGLASSDTLTVTYTDNGLTQFSDTAVPVMPSDDSMEPLALEPPANASIVKLTTMTMDEMPDAPGAPDSMPNGLLDFQLKPDEPGAEVQLVVYLSSPAPANAGWAKFQNNEWVDYSEHATFSADRMSVTLTFIEGGIGDDDGIVNGFISDPSGMTVPVATSTTGSTSASGGGGGGGCLIQLLR